MAEPPADQAKYVVTEDVERRYALEQTRMSLEAGWLGRVFGSATNAPTNIVGFVVLLLIVPGIALLFAPSNMSAVDYLKLVLPVITLVLGYLSEKAHKVWVIAIASSLNLHEDEGIPWKHNQARS